MPVFHYKGVDAASKAIKGVVDAESEKAARAKLRKQRIFPTQIHADRGSVGKRFGGGGVNQKQIAHMTRQLSILLNANIPLIDALAALQEQVEHPLMRKSLADIKDNVSEGARLWESMNAYPKIFDPIYVNMVKAGEASGALETIMTRLAEYKENQVELASKIQSAMIYPVIMMLFSLGMMTFLFGFVIPEMARLFEKQKVALPKLTQIVLAISTFMTSYWYWVILVFVVAFFLFKRYKNSENGRQKIDAYKLRMPIFGSVNQKVAVARFSRTLSTLLNSGVQLLQGLEIVREVLNNVILAAVVENTMARVKEGESLSETLDQSQKFPKMFIQMLSVGERTGMLEDMLDKVANTYDNEAKVAVAGLTSLITPLLAVVMGIVVALVVLSVLMPIMQLGNTQI